MIRQMDWVVPLLAPPSRRAGWFVGEFREQRAAERARGKAFERRGVTRYSRRIWRHDHYRLENGLKPHAPAREPYTVGTGLLAIGIHARAADIQD
jgi:hypothetical protein